MNIHEQFYNAIDANDLNSAASLVLEHPELLLPYGDGRMYLHDAAWHGRYEIVNLLVEAGCNSTATDRLTGDTPLMCACAGMTKVAIDNHRKVVYYLLSRDPQQPIGRSVLSAVRIPDEAKALEVATLLLDHGVDVNALYDAFGNPDRLFTALDHAAGRPALVELLKARGGKTAAELVGNERALHKQPPPGDATDPVVQFFAAHYGPVGPLALQEIVPGDPPLTLRVVPSPGPKQPTTVFTSGMAAEPLNCPPEWADEGFAHCECFLQLPAKWPYAEIKQAKHRWPFEWLARIARTPHQNGTWMGGLTAIFDNGSPPEPLASGLPFDSWLAINAHTIDAGEHGPAIRLYHLVPLHPAERELAEKQGVEAMLKALDKAGVGFAIDVKRPSAV